MCSARTRPCVHTHTAMGIARTCVVCSHACAAMSNWGEQRNHVLCTVCHVQRIVCSGHRYAIGECNYGGRVTDDKDRRLLMAALSRIYRPEILTDSPFNLSASGVYTVPESGDMQSVLTHINQLPAFPLPEVRTALGCDTHTHTHTHTHIYHVPATYSQVHSTQRHTPCALCADRTVLGRAMCVCLRACVCVCVCVCVCHRRSVSTPTRTSPRTWLRLSWYWTRSC